MKLGIMQPYFFPYLGYFALMKYVDDWVIFDTPQYDRKGWMNRNRILDAADGWQYIRVAVRKPAFGSSIADVRVDDSVDWRGKIMKQLSVYRRIAPHFDEVRAFLERALQPEEESLAMLNTRTLVQTCEYLGIHPRIHIFSQMNPSIGEVCRPGDWALSISRHLGASEYVNPPGGREIFSPENFDEAGIELRFMQANLRPYAQARQAFIPGLSIVDAMMFTSKDAVRRMLDDYHWIDPQVRAADAAAKDVASPRQDS